MGGPPAIVTFWHSINAEWAGSVADFLQLAEGLQVFEAQVAERSDKWLFVIRDEFARAAIGERLAEGLEFLLLVRGMKSLKD